MSGQFGSTLDNVPVLESRSRACMKRKSYCEAGAKIRALNIDLAMVLAFQYPWALSKVYLSGDFRVRVDRRRFEDGSGCEMEGGSGSGGGLKLGSGSMGPGRDGTESKFL